METTRLRGVPAAASGGSGGGGSGCGSAAAVKRQWPSLVVAPVSGRRSAACRGQGRGGMGRRQWEGRGLAWRHGGAGGAGDCRSPHPPPRASSRTLSFPHQTRRARLGMRLYGDEGGLPPRIPSLPPTSVLVTFPPLPPPSSRPPSPPLCGQSCRHPRVHAPGTK